MTAASEGDLPPQASLVISAPEDLSGRLAIQAGARLTLGVLVELAIGATDRLVLASPYLNVASLLRGGVVAQAINTAIVRGVRIEIASAGGNINELRAVLLETTGALGGRVRLFQPQVNLLDDRRLGSHAKFCIADTRKAYLGSANFTTPGLGEHLEMGVLLEGVAAGQVARFWDDLKAIGLFVEV